MSCFSLTTLGPSFSMSRINTKAKYKWYNSGSRSNHMIYNTTQQVDTCVCVCVVCLCNKTATKPSFSNSRYWHQKKPQYTNCTLHIRLTFIFSYTVCCLCMLLWNKFFFLSAISITSSAVSGAYDKCAEFNELVNSLVIRTWLNDLSIVSVDFIAIGCISDVYCDRTFILLALHC